MDLSSFWKDVLSKNRAALPSYFCEDAVIRWHCTNEQFSVAEFVRANCDYPGEWEGMIERTEESGDLLISVVKVFPRDRSASFHAVSFFAMEEGRIRTLDEYWADDGDAPAWRKRMGIGRPIR